MDKTMFIARLDQYMTEMLTNTSTMKQTLLDMHTFKKTHQTLFTNYEGLIWDKLFIFIMTNHVAYLQVYGHIDFQEYQSLVPLIIMVGRDSKFSQDSLNYMVKLRPCINMIHHHRIDYDSLFDVLSDRRLEGDIMRVGYSHTTLSDDYYIQLSNSPPTDLDLSPALLTTASTPLHAY